MEEHVQKTGVAIETQGFTFVTSGKKRESLTVRYLDFRNHCSAEQCIQNNHVIPNKACIF